MFAAHINNFSSNLVECIDFSGSSALLWEGHVFFRINNTELKWCRRASHLGRFTLWNSGRRRATQLGRFTLWHYGRLASQLAGKFALWHNGRRAKQPVLMHAPGVACIFQRKI